MRFGEMLAKPARATASRSSRLSPGLVRTRDDLGGFPRRRAVDAAGARAAARARARVRAASTRSRGATSTPSTTTGELEPRIDEILADDLNAIRLRR